MSQTNVGRVVQICKGLANGIKKGTRLQDRYIITEIIAWGGEGEVYKAIDERWNGLVVAIKETRFDDQSRCVNSRVEQ
jgi:hypothetical protein